MAKYISGRVKRTAQDKLTDTRFKYLNVADSEPNLGDSPNASGTPGVPSGQQFQLISVLGDAGGRYWSPIQGGIIPGSISVFEENVLVGTLSSITQLDFVGNVSTVTVGPLIDSPRATITLKPPGDNDRVLFKSGDDFSSSNKLQFRNAVGILTVSDGLEVTGSGTNKSFIVQTDGKVGINTAPTQELHIGGNIRLEGTLLDQLNDPGSLGDILQKNNSGGIEWKQLTQVQTGAGGTIKDVQFHGSTGLVEGASNFNYDPSTNRVGLGIENPTALLDVRGDVNFATGITTVARLEVTGISTFSGIVSFRNDVKFEDNDAAYFGSGLDLKIFHDGSNSLIDDERAGGLRLRGSTIALEKYHGGVNPEYMIQAIGDGSVFVYHNGNERFRTTGAGVSVTGTLDTDVLDTVDLVVTGSLDVKDLEVTGIATIDQMKFYDGTIETTSGNLTLDSSAGTVSINDIVYVNDDTQSTSKDNGALHLEGGAGIEKNLNVGEMISVAGISTLASAGGITTTGGDLYVAGDIHTARNIFVRDFNATFGNITGILTTNDFKVVGISTFLGDLDFGDSSNDRISINARIDTTLLPDHNATSNTDPSGKDIGNSSNNWRTIHAQEFVGDVTGISTGAEKVKISTVSDNQTYHITFVDNINTEYQSVVVDGDSKLVFNPDTNLLTTQNFVANGTVTLGDEPQDNIHLRGDINTDIIPSGNSTLNVGSGSTVWQNIHATTFHGQLTGGNADRAEKVQVHQQATGNYYIVGVGTNNVSGANEYQDIMIDSAADLTYNTNQNLLVSPKARFSQLQDSNGSAGANGHVPVSDGTNWLWQASSGLVVDVAKNLEGGLAFQIPHQTAADTTAFLPNGTEGKILTAHGTTSAPTWETNAARATNLVGGAQGSLPFQSAPNVTAFLSIGTAGKVLKVNSSGTAPEWGDSVATAVDLIGGTANFPNVVIQTAANSTSFLARGSADQVLKVNSTGNGFVFSSVGDRVSNLDGGEASQIPYQKQVNETGFIPNGNLNDCLISNGTAAPTWGKPIAGEVEVQARNASTADHFLTFVDSNNNTPQRETFYTDNALKWVPTSDRLELGDLRCTTLSTHAGDKGSSGEVLTSKGSSQWEWTPQGDLLSGKVETQSRTTDAWHFLAFIDSNNSSKQEEDVWTDANLVYNPNTNLLQSETLRSGLIERMDGSRGTTGQVLTSQGNSAWTWTTIGGSNFDLSVRTLTITSDLDAGNKDQGALLVQNGGVGIEKNLKVGLDIFAFATSDIRLKDNITPISEPLSKVLSLSGNTFNWKEGFSENHSNEGADTGVIAQEVESLDIPGIITTRDDGMKAVKYEKLIPLLIEAIKELKAEVDELKSHKH